MHYVTVDEENCAFTAEMAQRLESGLARVCSPSPAGRLMARLA
jgi:hypothetical protein